MCIEGRRAPRLFLVAFLSVITAGCGASLGTAPTPQERVEDFAAMSSRLGSLHNTGYAGQPGQVPASGRATFTGHAGFVFATAPVPLALLGDARISIDFGSGELSGTANNFFGDGGGMVGDYAGSVAFVNGRVGSPVPNDIGFDYVGALTGQGNSILLDGRATGKLKGTPIQGLLASSRRETELVNGAATNSQFAIAAEID